MLRSLSFSFLQNGDLDSQNEDLQRRVQELMAEVRQYEKPSGLMKVCSSPQSSLPSNSQLQQIEEERKVTLHGHLSPPLSSSFTTMIL